MSAKILVAEDNEKFAALLKSLLEKNGMQALVARDGIEALGIIAREKPAAVLLDLRLPRLSGVDVLKKMRQAETTRHIPVVVLTGAYRGDQNARAILRLGASAFLEKPCKPSQILSALGKAMAPAAGKAPSGNRRSIARLLVEAFGSVFSGRLLLSSKGVEHQLTILAGLPVSLSPGFDHPDLGASLKDRGIIADTDYDYFCRQQKKDPELFVRMGLLEYPELMQARLAYLEEELSAALELVPESVSSEPIATPAGMQPVTVNLPQVLYQGYRQAKKPWPGIASLLGRYAAPSPAYFRFINFLTLTLPDRQLLQRIDGSKPVRGCLEGHENPAPLLRVLTDLRMLQLGDAPLKPSDSGEMPLHRLFNRLEEEELPAAAAEETVSFDDLMEGGLDLPARQQAAPEQAAAEETSSIGAEVRKLAEQIKGKNYYEMLGLSQQKFSFDALKANYFKLSRQLGPEVIMQLTGEEGAIAQELLADISNAYNTLSDVVKKESYDEMLGSDKIGLGREGDDVFQAEVHFQSGKVFLEMEDWEAAEKALREAYNADQQKGIYLAHLAWAIYKNPKHANSRATLDRAKQMLNKSLTMDRSAEGFAYKGWILIDSNQISLSEAEFTKALKLNARNTLARQGMRAIQERREAEKKGLFRRMFR